MAIFVHNGGFSLSDGAVWGLDRGVLGGRREDLEARPAGLGRRRGSFGVRRLDFGNRWGGFFVRRMEGFSRRRETCGVVFSRLSRGHANDRRTNHC